MHPEAGRLSAFVVPLLAEPRLQEIQGFRLTTPVCGICYYSLTGAENAKTDSLIAIGVSVGFFALGFVYLISDSLRKGKPLFLPVDISHPVMVVDLLLLRQRALSDKGFRVWNHRSVTSP